MNKYITIFLLFFTLSTLTAKSQRNYNNPCVPGDTLIDKFLRVKIIVDSTSKYLTGLDWNNNVLWRTNPWEIESFRSYDSSMNKSFHSNHITAFFLSSNKKRRNDPYIYLRFYNSPIAALVETKNGKLHLIGVM